MCVCVCVCVCACVSVSSSTFMWVNVCGFCVRASVCAWVRVCVSVSESTVWNWYSIPLSLCVGVCVRVCFVRLYGEFAYLFDAIFVEVGL